MCQCGILLIIVVLTPTDPLTMQDKIDASSLAARSSRNIQLERDSNTTAAYTMTTTYKSTATLIVLWLITICSIGIIGLTAFLYGSATVNGAEAATLAASLVCVSGPMNQSRETSS